jgi:hypothetical protein
MRSPAAGESGPGLTVLAVARPPRGKKHVQASMRSSRNFRGKPHWRQGTGSRDDNYIVICCEASCSLASVLKHVVDVANQGGIWASRAGAASAGRNRWSSAAEGLAARQKPLRLSPR